MLRALRDIAGRRDPVPEAVLSAARASIAWRDPDAALARLTADSAAHRLVAVRGGGSPRLLSFFGGSLTIDVQATTREGGVEMVGEVSPPVPARVVLESPGGSQETDVDDEGRFRFQGVVAGSVRLRCEPAGGAAVHTEWVLL
ncbi:hypothetical protein Daura_41765 [Dactylosporangium aurantiacum]|uniref:Carboxypeptidase regulatory-like domain-containing protein n=1 Tax=Dactylosporangium aurantiacum TaxID=35754 RepID=A0A9Q9IEZ1_9ACTN|nr:hypothetical protein [Dactylosporangium aurantiacum]MDG6102692.1 hypothetical protein [Dactylosporangium aurantiacum]UWZ53060.1 hypothetical protein Daura_41765 [Dactylosporangium aurantiacum]